MKSDSNINRRDLGRSAVGLGAAFAAKSSLANQVSSDLPRRQLGKTGIEVGLLGVGTVPFGRSEMSQNDVNRVVDAAIEAGINYFDTAPNYSLAERRLGVALKGKRDKVVLVTKVEATSMRDANWYIRESLMKLQTEYFDLVHIHNVGLTDRFPSIEAVMASDGVLEALRRQKEKGVVRHIGMTTHLRPKRAFPIIDTGDIEVVMCTGNFVERHTYNFEGTVFEKARERGLGIVAMKILGGPQSDGARLSDPEHYDDALRYAIGIPGLSVAILGVKSVAELHQALDTVTSYRPFSEAELSRITEKGKKMASEWGELRGPVAWG